MDIERTPLKTNPDDKVWVTVHYTVNLGNYENVKLEAGFSRTIKPLEDPLVLIDQLCEEVLNVTINKGEEWRGRLKENNSLKPKN